MIKRKTFAEKITEALGFTPGDISGKVDKETGKALLSLTEAAKIHAAESDNQDLSSFITDSDSRLTDARTPTTHTHESSGGLSQAQILTRQL